MAVVPLTVGLVVNIPPPPPPRVALEGKGRSSSDAAPEAVRQAVGGGCQSGWGRLLSVTKSLSPALAAREAAAGHSLGALEGGGDTPPLSNAPPPPCETTGTEKAMKAVRSHARLTFGAPPCESKGPCQSNSGCCVCNFLGTGRGRA